MTLFRRTNHGIVLTEAGKSIYRDARRIIHISEQALVTASTHDRQAEHYPAGQFYDESLPPHPWSYGWL